MSKYPDPVVLTLTLKDGSVKVAKFATCAGALNLMEKLGVNLAAEKGSAKTFSVEKGSLSVSYDLTYLMTTGTGKVWAAGKAASLKKAAAAAAAEKAAKKAAAEKKKAEKAEKAAAAEVA